MSSALERLGIVRSTSTPGPKPKAPPPTPAAATLPDTSSQEWKDSAGWTHVPLPESTATSAPGAPGGTALERLGVVPRGTIPDTLTNPPTPGPTAAEPRTLGEQFGPESVIRKDLEARAARFAPAPDVQALASPTERVMQAITAPGRGFAGMADAALRGENPLESTDAAGQRHVPFYEGMFDPQSSFVRTIRQNMPEIPDINMSVPIEPGDMRQVPLRPVAGVAATAAGIAADVAANPALLAGFGGVTEAGQAYRAAEIGLNSARMELSGALNYREALAASNKLDEALGQLQQAATKLKAEGTLASKGRAAVTYAGRTNPLLSQGDAVATTQQIMGKLGQTRLARGVSHLFQPVQMRVDPAIRARGYAVEAAGDVGKREAMRGMSDLVSEYPEVLKAVGGQPQNLDDALSLAIERSMGRRFDVPTDWMTQKDRELYWSTPDEGVRGELVKDAQKQARAALPQYLKPDETKRLRILEGQSEQNVERMRVLGGPEDAGARLTSEMTPQERAAHDAALEGERKRVARVTWDRARYDKDMLVQEAQDRFGNWVSADNTRDLFPEYARNLTSRSLHAASVHEGASEVTKAWYDAELAKPPKNGVVLVTGGGPGSGKTSGLPEEVRAHADVVYDAASGKGTVKAVRKAIDSGRAVDFWYTLRDPMESWGEGHGSVLQRATKQGRTVPVGLAANAHSQGIVNTRDLLKEFEPEYKAGQLQFHVVDNRYGWGNALRYDGDAARKILDRLPIPNEEALREAFTKETERQAASGTIPHRVYAGSLLDPRVDVPAPGSEVLGNARGGGAVERAGPDGGGRPEQGGPGGNAPGGPLVRTSSEISRDAYQREQATVTKQVQSIAADQAGIKSETQRLVARAQDRAHLQALKNSVLSARRMYFRGASPEAVKAFGDYAPKVIDRVNLRNATMFSNTVREGVKLSELADPQAYLTHASTPELQKAILDHAEETGQIPRGMGWRDFTEKHGQQLTRKMRMTAVEANQIAQTKGLAITGYKPVKQAFYTNPFIAQVYREQAGSRAIGYARHLRELANTYGHAVGSGPAPAGWRAVVNNVEGIGDKFLFDPDVAAHLTRHFEGLRAPGNILGAYDRLNQVWKQYTLGIFPVYHTRNEVSELWNSVILGGVDPKWAGPAMDEVLGGLNIAKPKGTREIVFDDGRKFAPGALRDEAEGMGVIRSSQMRQEIQRSVMGGLGDETAGGLPFAPAVKRIGKAVSEAGIGEGGARRLGSKVGAGLHAAQRQLTDNRVIDAAYAVGDARASALRMMAYIDRRSRGWSPEASAIFVRKHLIDYGQTSDFENAVVRRILPFYTWTRHNAPLQLEYLFAKPGAFGAVQMLRQQQGGEEGFGMGEAPLPEFLAKGLPIRSGTSAEGNPEFWRLEGNWAGADAMLPLSPLTDPQEAGRRGMALVSPWLKEIPEQVGNSDWFRSTPGGKTVPITDWEGQLGSFLGMPMNKRLIHVLSNLRPLTELNRLNPGNVFGTDTEPAFGGRGAVRERPDLDPSQRWLNVGMGRGYAVDPARNASDWSRAVDHLLRVLESEVARDEAQGKTAAADAARRKYEYTLEHPESVSPDMAK